MEKDHKPLLGSRSGDTSRGFAFVALLAQVVILIIYIFAVDYRLKPADDVPDNDHTALSQERVGWIYPMFQDVHVMIFVGFGFLMTFLKGHGWSALGYTMVVSVLAIEWGIITLGVASNWFENHNKMIKLDMESLVNGDFAAAAVLISFGGVIGRITPTQLLVMCLIELVFYAINAEIGAGSLGAVDMGGSIFVHIFGAYFGLALSYALGRPKGDQDRATKMNGSTYQSDMFAMIGTLFLWMFWPSFNGALCPYDASGKERVVINTVLSLSSSCLTTFAVSRLVGGKFDMVHIQNSTLAGGVAVGSSADLVIHPGGALAIGMIAGTVSVLGYKYLSPYLESRFGLYDTCGIHNLHGMPGIIGAMGGFISAWAATDEAYGDNINVIFPVDDGESYHAGKQGGVQLFAMLITLGISLTSGYLTGVFIRMPSLFQQEGLPYSDENSWLLGDSDDEAGPTTKQGIINSMA